MQVPIPSSVLSGLLIGAALSSFDRATASDSESEGGIALYRQAAAASPEDSGAWCALGNALMQAARGDHDDAGISEAETAFRKALVAEPDSPSAMVGLAWVHNSRHAFDKGIVWAQRALEIDGHNHHAYALLGDAYLEYGEYDEAFDHYQKAIDIRPDLSSYSRAAQLLFVTGDTRRAQALMLRAIEAGGPHAENTAWCRAQLALMHFKTGSLVAAEKSAALALEAAPNNVLALQAMAQIKIGKGEFDAAIHCYQQALDQLGGRHGRESILLGLGNACAFSGLQDQARLHYEAFADACMTGSRTHEHDDGISHDHPPTAATSILLAQHYADHGENLEEALKIARAVHRTYRRNVYVLDTLAWSYFKTGMVEEAKDTIEKALRWGTPEARFLFHAGMIHFQLGHRSKAQMYLYQALNLNPNFDPKDAATAAQALRELSATTSTQQEGAAKTAPR